MEGGAHREEEGRHKHWRSLDHDGRWWKVAGEEGKSPESREEPENREGVWPLAQLGLEADFLKHVMGAPDSL
jgi:hypothetical protein